MAKTYSSHLTGYVPPYVCVCSTNFLVLSINIVLISQPNPIKPSILILTKDLHASLSINLDEKRQYTTGGQSVYEEERQKRLR